MHFSTCENGSELKFKKNENEKRIKIKKWIICWMKLKQCESNNFKWTKKPFPDEYICKSFYVKKRKTEKCCDDERDVSLKNHMI